MALVENPDVNVLEFPSRLQDQRPQWRQEVSARLRDFQLRRENRTENPPLPSPRMEKREPVIKVAVADFAPGVVSLTHRKELDLRVIRALQRIERGRANMKTLDANRPGAAALRDNSLAETALAPESEEATPSFAPPRISLLKSVETQPVTLQPVAPETDTADTPAFTGFARRVATKPSEPQHQFPAPPEAEELIEYYAEPKEFAVPLDTTGVTDFAEPKPAFAEPQTGAPRRISLGVIDEAFLARREAARESAIQEKRKQIALEQGLYDDFAPLWVRTVASGVDWVLAFGVTLPLLILTIWAGWSWSGLFLFNVVSMIGFYAVYATLLTYFKGRTCGQELLFLSVNHVDSGESPTLKQCVLRTGVYLLSPITFGIGLLYALWDAEGRTLHDKFSGTIVLRN